MSQSGRSGTARHQRSDIDFSLPRTERPSEQTTWRSACQEGAPTPAQPEQRVLFFRSFRGGARRNQTTYQPSPQGLQRHLARKIWRLEGNRETGETLAEETKTAKLPLALAVITNRVEQACSRRRDFELLTHWDFGVLAFSAFRADHATGNCYC